MFYCKKCGNEVNAGNVHCSNCGADVFDNYEVVCEKCGKRNAGGSKFCSDCGASLAVIRKPVCVICGAVNEQGAKFCSSCGSLMMVSEETHSFEDIIKFHKLKMDATSDNARQEEFEKAQTSKRLEKLAEAELEVEKEIENKKKDFDEYVSLQSLKLKKYKIALENEPSFEHKKLAKMSEEVSKFARFVEKPYEKLSEIEKARTYAVCPVCGAKNTLNDENCYACGRNFNRSIELLKKGLLIRMPNYGKIEEYTISKADIDIEPKRIEFDDIVANKEELKSDEEKLKKVINVDEKSATLENEKRKNVQNNFGIGQASQPIVQPVAFVPYVTNDPKLIKSLNPFQEGGKK